MPPSKDDGREAASFTSSDRIAVPTLAVDRLRECIRARQDGNGSADQLRAAIAPICDEARRTDAMPEQLLISLKELCHSLPEYERIRGARERSAFLDSVVRLAIEEYYRV